NAKIPPVTQCQGHEQDSPVRPLLSYVSPRKKDVASISLTSGESRQEQCHHKEGQLQCEQCGRDVDQNSPGGAAAAALAERLTFRQLADGPGGLLDRRSSHPTCPNKALSLIRDDDAAPGKRSNPLGGVYQRAARQHNSLEFPGRAL